VISGLAEGKLAFECLREADLNHAFSQRRLSAEWNGEATIFERLGFCPNPLPKAKKHE
jgi:hypothetical protein